MNKTEKKVVQKAIDRLYGKEPLEPNGHPIPPSIEEVAYAIGLLEALLGS